MTQILIVINDKDLSTTLRGKLAQKYDVEVIVRNSAPEAISLFEILPDIEIILCSEFIDKAPAAEKICDYLKTKKVVDSREINIAVIGKHSPAVPKAVCIGENPSIQKIIAYLGFLLGKEEKNILAEEEREERERAEKEKREREKTEEEILREELERQRIEKEKADQARLARERARAEKAEREQLERELAEQEKIAKKKAIEERVERGKTRLEQIQKEKEEKERAEREKAEKIRLANELAKEQALQERLAREQAEKEKLEREKLEKERQELEKLEKEKAFKEKLEKEREERERLAKERERIQIELAEKERLEKEKIDNEKRKFELAEKERAAQERLERANLRLEKVEREKAEQEKELLLKRKLDEEKFEKERAEREKAMAEKLEKAKAKIGHGEKTKKIILPVTGQLNETEKEKTTVFHAPEERKIEEKIEPLPPKINHYVPFNVIYFVSLFEELVDFSVYSRIKKGDGFEYIKKINANSKLSLTELERLLLRCGKELYISDNEFNKANIFLNGFFLERFKNSNLSQMERITLNSDSFEILLDLFKYSSLNKHNVEIIKELIKSMDIQSHDPDALNSFLAGLKSKKISYGYSHAFLSYFLLLKIADHFPWVNDHSKNKLLYLSLFHDLSLNTDRLIKLHHNYIHEIKNLNEEEKEIMFAHADNSAKVLETIVKAPLELATLIREHHGFKNGKGHTEGLSIAISPTSMAFVVIEDFVTHYLGALEKMEAGGSSGPNAQELEPIFIELRKKYDRLTYADVLSELQKIYNFSH